MKLLLETKSDETKSHEDIKRNKEGRKIRYTPDRFHIYLLKDILLLCFKAVKKSGEEGDKGETLRGERNR